MSSQSCSAARRSHALRTVLLSLIALFGLLQARPTPPALRIRADDSGDATSNDSDTYARNAVNVTFTPCEGPSLGEVTSMEISPCDRSSDSEACTFKHGRNYTISLGFISQRNSSIPRSSVQALDGDQPYAYSGQSFNACKYAPCPIVAEEPSTYVYQFHTLASPFDHLSFNVTDNFAGPSLFCAGTNINFEP